MEQTLEDFRAETRAWLEGHCPAEMRQPLHGEQDYCWGGRHASFQSDAQRLWLQYRDANCQFYADPDGGTAAGVAAADCVLQMTAGRARELAGLRP